MQFEIFTESLKAIVDLSIRLLSNVRGQQIDILCYMIIPHCNLLEPATDHGYIAGHLAGHLMVGILNDFNIEPISTRHGF